MLVLVALTLLCGWWTQVEAIKFEMKAEINPDAHQSKWSHRNGHVNVLGCAHGPFIIPLIAIKPYERCLSPEWQVLSHNARDIDRPD